jgi:archaeosortase A (PGF-CTERM-specific)
MILQSALAFIAIGLFLLTLLFRNKRERLRTEQGEAAFSTAGKREKVAGASGWIFFAGYSYFEAFDYFAQGEYFGATLSLVYLAFSLLLVFLLMKTRENEDLFFDITKVALIAFLFYFPFSEIYFLGDLLIFITAKITTQVLNHLNVGSVYMVPPSFIYLSTNPSFNVDIILDCTAIQSIALFTGVIFGINAPMQRKLKAFFVSVPILYVLNIFRLMFVTSAYFGQWFGTQSFDIAHGLISRFGEMASLIVIAYAVFVILPEALDLIEDLFRFFNTIFSTRIKG